MHPFCKASLRFSSEGDQADLSRVLVLAIELKGQLKAVCAEAVGFPLSPFHNRDGIFQRSLQVDGFHVKVVFDTVGINMDQVGAGLLRAMDTRDYIRW